MNHRMRCCLTKRPYESEAEASRTIKQIIKDGKMANYMGLEPYKRAYCPHWHVGHKRKVRR